MPGIQETALDKELTETSDPNGDLRNGADMRNGAEMCNEADTQNGNSQSDTHQERSWSEQLRELPVRELTQTDHLNQRLLVALSNHLSDTTSQVYKNFEPCVNADDE